MLYITNSDNSGEHQYIDMGHNCAAMRDYNEFSCSLKRLACWDSIEELAEWAARVAHYKNAALMDTDAPAPLAIIRDYVAV